LVGFGAHAGLPQHLVAGAVNAAVRMAAPAFDVTFDRAVSFVGRPRPLVLCGSGGLDELIVFQRALGTASEKAGLARVKRQWMPHVTLLYDEKGIEQHPIEPIRWTVREFALVHSLRGRSRYNILGRWPLHNRLPLAS